MKGFTDLEQSKKLAEILPLESADMWWLYITAQGKHIAMMYEEPDPHYLARMERQGIKDAAIPCWSLSALLDVIPWGQVNRMTNSSKWAALSWKSSNFVPEYPCVEGFDTPVDACYELVLKLHEHKIF